MLLLILGLLMLLIIIPFNYSGQVLAAGGFKVQLSFGWAWKLLGINAEIEGEAVDISLRVLDKRVYRLKNRKPEEAEKQAEQKPEKEEKEKKRGKGPGIRDFADKALIREVLDYIKRVLDIAKPKYFHLYGTYGFDDPSLTGVVCGATGIIRNLIPNARLNLTPDFTQEIIDLDLRAEGSMTVGSLAYQTLRTAFKKPVRRILFRRKKS
ncbi:MAG TPA: DUF2953 domain-containing protein [Clostridia bacterium]|nr:DUF2953 domain-containing protein [Clostridia bacterium]